MSEKRMIQCICLSVICGALLLCTTILQGEDLSGKVRRDQKIIGTVYMTMNNPYFEVINQEIETQVTEAGDILLTRDSNLDNEMQIRQIESLIEEKVDILLVNAVDWKGVRPALEEAKEAGIPVIALDTEVYDSDLVLATLTSDNYLAGGIAAHDLMKHCDQAEILLLEHTGNKSADDRIQGFLDTLDEHEWPYHIVDRLDCSGQLEIAQPLVEEILEKTRKIDVVMALNDPGALGAMAALDAQGMLSDVIVYGIDGAPEAKAMIYEGKMTGTVAQSPTRTGQTAADMIYDYFDGKQIDRVRTLPVTLINQQNIGEFSLSNWE